MAMFGGQPKDVQNAHRIRGDINVLILGDPGTAKSQFLKYTEKTFPRCVYTTGKGASAVGLTASVHKDYVTKEWTLEGGALVIADKGICLIDEFDKMNEHDRTSIHEAMEQQSISISKAGIVANLKARCSVIAAANPIKGRYNSQLSFSDNVELTDPILSRFDILCVVKDEVDIDNDSDLAAFVINSHIKNHPEMIKIAQQDVSELQEQQIIYNQEFQDRNQAARIEEKRVENQLEKIPHELLKKYITFARQYCKPKLSGVDKDKIVKFYTELRQESNITGGIQIAVRHIESVIRMSEAHARMHLRDIVRDDDVNVAIATMLEGFIQSQKFSVAKVIRKKFSHYLNNSSDKNALLIHYLNKIFRDKIFNLNDGRERNTEIKIPLQQLEYEARNYNIFDLHEFLISPEFMKNYTLRGQVIVRTITNL